MSTPRPHTDSVHDELAARLNASDAEKASGAFRVEEVLKRSDVEETQLVYLRLCDGREIGPYVRKVIDASSGLGGAYPLLARAQRGGARFRQLPRIIDCREKDGRLEVVMEYVRGATLREVVERAGEGAGAAAEKAACAGAVAGAVADAAPRPEAGTASDLAARARLTLAERLMPAVCDAVRELHECAEEPIVHRDLTPGNVLVPVADPLRPVLIDFGIARTWKDGARCDTTHFGTRAYAPPEQFGFGQTDVRTDVYALGMLAFFCLTGRDPEPSDREAGFAAPGVPERWQEVVRTATALDPRERYADVAELRAALPGAAAVADEIVPANEGEVTAVCAHADEGVGAGTGASAGAGTPGPVTAGEGSAKGPAGLARGGRSGASPLPAAALTHVRGRLVGAAVPERLLGIWNVLVVAATALFCAASVSLVLDERAMAGGPTAFRAFGYVAWMPCGFMLVGYLLLSKRRLRARVAYFRDRTPRQVLRVLLLVYLGVTVVWLALVAL